MKLELNGPILEKYWRILLNQDIIGYRSEMPVYSDL